MESTFIIKKEDFNSDFVEAVKKLFSKSRELQITINSSEDFDVLKSESIYETRDVEKKKNTDTDFAVKLDEMTLSKENQLLYEMSNSSFANAWAEDEPEYSLNDIKTVNPDYEGR